MGRRVYALAAVVLVSVTACGDGGLAQPSDVAAPDAAITLIIPDQTSDYFRAIRAGAVDGARDRNLDLTIVEGASSSAEQISAITEAIARGDQGIAISPVSPEVDSALSAARNSGTAVVTIGGTGVEVKNSDFTVQTDDCVLGLAAGQWISGRLPEGSIFWPDFTAHFLRVIGDTGEYPRPSCRDEAWLQGAGIDPALIAGTPPGNIPSGTYAGGAAAFDIPCTVIFNGDLNQVTEDVRTCVSAHPEINAAYASSGDLARAAGDGLRFAGKTVGVDVLLTTIGGTGEALALARGSWVNATARPRVRATGGSAISALADLIEGRTPTVQGDKSFLDTGVDLCTDQPTTAVFVAVTMSIDACVERLEELRP
jgi:fructose transport system substrate-binding protein